MKNILTETWQIDRSIRWRDAHRANLLEQFTPRIKAILEKENPEIISDVNKSMFFTGKSGTGKTVHACREAINWHYTKFVDRKNPKFMIIKVPVLLDTLRSLLMNNEAKNEFVTKLKSIQLLILDDLGACNLSDWATEILYIIIDYRYDEMKKTYYTSNFTLEQLAELNQDDRIVRRIYSDCKENIIEFTNEPYL